MRLKNTNKVAFSIRTRDLMNGKKSPIMDLLFDEVTYIDEHYPYHRLGYELASHLAP